jgi:hypothetical protein
LRCNLNDKGDGTPAQFPVDVLLSASSGGV